MSFVCAVHQIKALAKFAMQALRAVAHNIQPTATLWSIGSKSCEDDMSTHAKGMSYSVYVALAISRLGQEVEHRSIMPEVIGLFR